MTLFERLRAWLGGLTGESGTASEADDPAPSDDPTPRVVHRDDRPLETPGTMERPNPPASSSSDRTHVEVPDAETATTRESSPRPDTVSIPDAEAAAEASLPTDDAGTAPASETDVTTPDADPDSAPKTDGADGAVETGRGDAPPDTDAAESAAFACSVCGTTVDDPSEPCPLCRSTDVVPVADADAADEPLTRGGRTTVSAADDEAVDRLRDVKDYE